MAEWLSLTHGTGGFAQLYFFHIDEWAPFKDEMTWNIFYFLGSVWCVCVCTCAGFGGWILRLGLCFEAEIVIQKTYN